MQIYKIHLSSVDSTNTYAKKHYSSFPEGFLTSITAEEQTAGRGRFQRTWNSPKGQNLLVTFHSVLPKGQQDLHLLAQLMAFTLKQLLEELGFSPEMKWPNDLLLSKKKVAGILCELEESPRGIELIMGVGLNVNAGSEFLDKIDQPATSLAIEKGTEFSLEKVLKRLECLWIKNIELFRNKGARAVFEP